MKIIHYRIIPFQPYELNMKSIPETAVCTIQHLMFSLDSRPKFVQHIDADCPSIPGHQTPKPCQVHPLVQLGKAPFHPWTHVVPVPVLPLARGPAGGGVRLKFTPLFCCSPVIIGIIIQT